MADVEGTARLRIVCPNVLTSSLATAQPCVADRGSIEAVQLMLDLRFPVDPRVVDGCTPMHVAAFARRAGVVRLLMDYGGDLEAVDAAVQRPHTTPR